MKVLVIGGCGFIGSHVVDRLILHGHTVRVFDRKPEYFRAPLPGVEYHMGNFSDPMAIAEALVGIDGVLHLVSTTFPGTANLDPRTDVMDNLCGTLALLEMMVRAEVQRVVFLSSGGTVYGPPDIVPIPESHPLRPINSYGIVKSAIEHYLAMYQTVKGLSPVSIRASNPYGPRQAHIGVQGVVATFIDRILTGKPIEIWGDGSVVRDYLHVTDLAELCVRAIHSDRTGPYNAGSGRGVSLNRIVEILGNVSGREIAPMYKSARKIDVQKSVLDTNKARADFDWTCAISLQDGVRETYEWARAHRA